MSRPTSPRALLLAASLSLAAADGASSQSLIGLDESVPARLQTIDACFCDLTASWAPSDASDVAVPSISGVDGSAASASGETTVLCWNRDLYDLDGDGYARADAPTSAREEKISPTGFPLSPPEGWVTKRGDLDDDDPEVHPRRLEVPENGIDDDCDDLVDEPEPLYSTSGYANSVDGFEMWFRLNDAEARAFAEPGIRLHSLAYTVEYQRLARSGRAPHRSELALAELETYGEGVFLHARLTGLQPGEVYRARIQLHRAYFLVGTLLLVDAGEIGDVSDWYFTMTEGLSDLGRRRSEVVIRGLYEFYLSEHLGYVGHEGTYAYGARYGGEEGEAWCSEFASYVLSQQIASMGSLNSVGAMEEWFESRSALTSVEVGLDVVEHIRPGDYLAMDTTGDGSLNHSDLFLAWDEESQILWTLDGNANGYGPDSLSSYANRHGGNEVQVRESSVDWIGGWGRLRLSFFD